MDVLICNVPEAAMRALDALATQAHLDREGFLRLKLIVLAETNPETVWTPARFGEGFKAFTPTGGSCTLKRLGKESVQIQRGAKNLFRDEFDAYERAALVASPLNGNAWQSARRILEEAGFEVFNI